MFRFRFESFVADVGILSGVDRLEHELQGELENARLVRLMTKFGFINERPESVSWLPTLANLLANREFQICSRATVVGDRGQVYRQAVP